MNNWGLFKKTFVFFLFLALLGCGKDFVPKLVKNHIFKATAGIVVNPQLDILFVIDNSGSMGTHQTHLANQIDLFLQGLGALSHIDYQIGVITTDTARRMDLRKTPYKKGDPVINLKKMLQVGTNGPATEVHLATIQQALIDSIASQSVFYRSKAHLAIIFITDTDDQGSVTGTQLYNYLLQLKNGRADHIYAYGAVDLLQPNCPGENVGFKRLQEFMDLVHANRVLLNSPYFSLCDSQFGLQLLDIGGSISQYVGRVIPLAHTPDLKSIVVKYGKKIIPQDALKGWVYNPRFVRLELGPDVSLKNPDPSVKLKVFYYPAGPDLKHL